MAGGYLPDQLESGDGWDPPAQGSVPERPGVRAARRSGSEARSTRSVPSDVTGSWSSGGALTLGELLRENPVPSLGQARAMLRNPFLSADILERLVQIPSLLAHYSWRSDLAGHKLVPIALAMNLVAGLYWRDLARLSTDVRVRPLVRRHADQTLAPRLSKLGLGEKIALARMCSHTITSALNRDSNPRVVQALLENPRLTESLVLPMMVPGRSTPEITRVVASSKWGLRYPVKLAICRNPATPNDVSLPLLPSLRKNDLRSLVSDLGAPVAVRTRCRVLLEDQPNSP